MIIDIITIFPGMFAPVLEESIIKRAREKGLVKINLHDLRRWCQDKHRKVDDAAYGAGAMVFKPEPFFYAVEDILDYQVYPDKPKDDSKRIVLLSPKGGKLTQKKVKQLLKYERLILLAPRYEGVDARVEDYLVDEEISIGDYILSGGELAAMVLTDAIVRLIPGVVSRRESIEKESFENSLLDCQHYTRPDDFRGLKVPLALKSGDPKKINAWREKKALEETKKKRPDLVAKRMEHGA